LFHKISASKFKFSFLPFKSNGIISAVRASDIPKLQTYTIQYFTDRHKLCLVEFGHPLKRLKKMSAKTNQKINEENK